MIYGKFIEVIGEIADNYRVVAKGVSTDEIRYFMNNCYCDKNHLISTDGRSMYILDLKTNPWQFEEGKFYRPLKTTAKTVWFAEVEQRGDFPNYTRVIPDGEHTDIDFIYYSPKKLEYFKQASKLFKFLPDGYSLNLNYLSSFSKPSSWTVEKYAEKEAVVFNSGDGLRVLIMPALMED